MGKKKDTPYAQDKVFQKNFTADFAKTLDSKFKKISYEDIDFSNAYKIVDKKKRPQRDDDKRREKRTSKEKKRTTRKTQSKIRNCQNGWKRC